MRLFFWLIGLTGLVYPLLVVSLGQLFFYEKAQGSLESQGSRLIAQKFTGNQYFWPRPSAIDYNPLPSGGSNLGPLSPELKKVVEERRRALGGENIPPELLFASGSGLDPHLTQEGALFQLERVATARGGDKSKIEAYIKSKRLVNVLEINLWMDTNP